MYKQVSFIFSALLLSACGGSGSSDPTATVLEFERQFDKWLISSPSVDVPTSGLASYSGSLTVTDDAFAAAPVIAMSPIEMNANFDSGTVTGTASDFFEFNSLSPVTTPRDGSISVDGLIFAGSLIDFAVDGTLMLEGQATTLDGNVLAEFFGDAGDLIYGERQNLPASGGTDSVDIVIQAD